MTEQQVKMLVDSYGLRRILETMDLEEEFVLDLLIELGFIEVEELQREYF